MHISNNERRHTNSTTMAYTCFELTRSCSSGLSCSDYHAALNVQAPNVSCAAPRELSTRGGARHCARRVVLGGGTVRSGVESLNHFLLTMQEISSRRHTVNNKNPV